MSGLEVHLDIQGSAEIARAFELAPEIVLEELERATWESELLLEREVKERTPVGVGGGGGLKGSIAAREPRRLADGVIGVVGTPLNYAVPVELGTKPHFPPVKPLAEWAVRKLGVDPSEARSVGFLIARKISRKGTKGAHMFEEGFKANRRQVVQFFEAARDRIAARIEEEAG